MTDYMLTVYGNQGHRDVQVNDAADIREAIRVAEKATGARVSHGRGGIGDLFRPSIVVNATTGATDELHRENALLSCTIAQPAGAAAVRSSMGGRP